MRGTWNASHFVSSVALVLLMSGDVAVCAEKGSEPIVLLAVAPQSYPALAVQAHAEGTVTVEVTIGPGGEVAKAEIADVQGSPRIFRQPWYEVLARRWRFTTTKNLAAIRKARIEFAFRLMPRGTPSEDLATTFTLPARVEVREEEPEEVINY